MNIPIYRARRIDSDEYKIGQLTNLVIPDIERISNDEQKDIEREAYFITKGSLCKNVGNSFEYCGENRFVYMISELNEIDPTTLAIHFPDMIDSQGNRIFASLQDDGKGGDIVEYNGGQEIIKYSNGTIQTYMFRFEDLKELNFKGIGIKE